jgi:hypothetical protein
MKQKDPTPLDAAQSRLESIWGQALKWAISSHSMERARESRGYASAILAKEPVIRDAISKSLEVWIQTGQVILADEDLPYFVDRMKTASRLCSWLKSGNCVPFEKSSNEILEWLLIHSWPEIGVALWADNFRD